LKPGKTLREWTFATMYRRILWLPSKSLGATSRPTTFLPPRFRRERDLDLLRVFVSIC